MRFNDLLHLVAFPWKAHGKSPAPGFVTATKMPESRALSKFSDHFSRYIPLSGETSRMLMPSTITARRTRRYTSTLYIRRTIYGVAYNP